MDIVRRKFLIPALCLFLLCGALAGCRSSEAAEAERLIAALSADAPDADAVARAREAYEALPEEEQEALEMRRCLNRPSRDFASTRQTKASPLWVRSLLRAPMPSSPPGKAAAR